MTALLSVLGRLGFDPDAPPPGLGASRDRWDAVIALLRVVRRLPDESVKMASALVEELRRRAEAEHAPTLESGVTLSTMHKSKGLEWDVVLIPELIEGLLPISRAKAPEEVAEECRLLYVAITRARQRLELSYASHSDKGSPKEASRFLSTAVPPGNFGSVPGKSAIRFTVGDRVLASAFGVGRVKAVGKIEATVDFGGSFGVKKVRFGSLSAL